MSSSNPHNVQVGTWVALRQRAVFSHSPAHVDYKMVQVVRVTATQAVYSQGSRECRFRLKDLAVVGVNYSYVEIATPEMLAENAAQLEVEKRYYAARPLVDDLIGKELHQLKLSVPQLEALGKAWTEIKAMGEKQ